MRFLPIIIGFILLISITEYYARKTGSANFVAFNESVISGKISFAGMVNKVDAFRIGNDSQTFCFASKSIKVLNKGYFFCDIASVGDSVYKEAFSDTLFLFKKNGETYKFNFH